MYTPALPNPTMVCPQVWTIRVEIVSLSNEYERRKWREKLGEVLAEKTLYTAEVHKYERSWARSW